MKNQWPVDFVIVIIAVTSINFDWNASSEYANKTIAITDIVVVVVSFFSHTNGCCARDRSFHVKNENNNSHDTLTTHIVIARSHRPRHAKWNEKINNWIIGRARLIDRRLPAHPHTHTCTHGVPVYASNVCDKFHSSNTLQNQSNSMLLLFSLFFFIVIVIVVVFLVTMRLWFCVKKIRNFSADSEDYFATRIASEYYFYRTK